MYIPVYTKGTPCRRQCQIRKEFIIHVVFFSSNPHPCIPQKLLNMDNVMNNAFGSMFHREDFPHGFSSLKLNVYSPVIRLEVVVGWAHLEQGTKQRIDKYNKHLKLH